MFKRFILLFSLILITFLNFDFAFSSCSYDWWWDVAWAIENCIWNWETYLVPTGGNLSVEEGFKQKIIYWNQKIATFLALWAIFSIVFGSLKMVLSAGEEEKIKKAKDIIKWWMVGLLAVVSAGFIVSLVVKLVYSVWNV